MTFTELLNKYGNLEIHKIKVAMEVDCWREYEINDAGDTKELTEEEFELVCNYIYDFFLQDDDCRSIEELVGGLFRAISNEQIEIADIKKDMNKVDEAVLSNLY